MNTSCPRCGKRYGLFDRLAQPITCAECDRKFGERSPLGSFDEDLALVPPGELEGDSVEQRLQRKRSIAKRNILIGAVLLASGGVVMIGSLLVLLADSATGGSIMITAGLFFAGIERLTRGVLQYRSLR